MTTILAIAVALLVGFGIGFYLGIRVAVGRAMELSKLATKADK